MKNRLYIGLTVLICSFMLTACDSFLDVDPKSDLTPDSFWKTENDANVGVIAIYHDFSKAMSSGYWTWGETRGGNFEYSFSQANLDLINNNIQIDNGAASWTNLYAAIGKANAAIKYIPDITMTLTTKRDFLAEAYAMRAWAYFYCIRVWGDVPLYLEPVESIDQGIYRERTDKDYIIENVILPDLEKAYTYISRTRDGTGSKRTRINVATICALLMDVYAWVNDYEMVVKIKEERVNLLNSSQWLVLTAENGVDFASNWRTMFFETTGDKAYPEVWLRMGYDRLGNGNNSSRSTLAEGTSRLRISPKLMATYDEIDGRAGVQWVGEKAQTSEGETTFYFLKKKFWTGNGPATEDADVDLVMYRYADIVLLYAEALNALGRMEEAVTELNKTYTRAGNPAFSSGDFLSSEELLDAILLERQREFVGEGKRWFDLVRTNMWAEHTNLTDPDKVVFPIHRDHLNQNPNLKQNYPAYPYP
ncbi:MAG: RagB/SusD family nutrient uptake outer membrane protein [Dysgonomonas sp.]|nr:RagB/SusD family nutrient uptake outer membrane protein [Dysgonomonas sp.]